MSLPPLPGSLAVFTPTRDQHVKLNWIVRDYGALCRKMALEEAAKEVDHIMFFNGKTFGEKIRELK